MYFSPQLLYVYKNLTLVRLVGRFLQGFTAMLALYLTNAGYPSTGGHTFNVDHTIALGSGSSVFLMLIVYTCLLYSIWYLTAVEFGQFTTRPCIQYERLTDASLTTLLLVAGFVGASSNYLAICDALGNAISCGSLTFGIVLTFLCAIISCGLCALTFLTRNCFEDEDFDSDDEDIDGRNTEFQAQNTKTNSEALSIATFDPKASTMSEKDKYDADLQFGLSESSVHVDIKPAAPAALANNVENKSNAIENPNNGPNERDHVKIAMATL